jgi:hypothetical protein
MVASCQPAFQDAGRRTCVCWFVRFKPGICVLGSRCVSLVAKRFGPEQGFARLVRIHLLLPPQAWQRIW